MARAPAVVPFAICIRVVPIAVAIQIAIPMMPGLVEGVIRDALDEIVRVMEECDRMKR